MNPKKIPAHAVWVAAALTTGCATYHPAPLEPDQILKDLEAIEWPHKLDPGPDQETNRAATGPGELSAFALETNPDLVVVRAELGIKEALLLEAGLLPDPEIGWDGMDVGASQIVTGSSSSVEALSGFGLMFPIPRFGERGARVGAAEWRLEEMKWLLLAAEWELTREVHVAFEEARGAEALLAQAGELTDFASSTFEYFRRAKDAGAATAIQANLAFGELQARRLEQLRAESRVFQAHQSLNALLGLPPDATVFLRKGDSPDTEELEAMELGELTKKALHKRPDLGVLLASYQAAEEEVKLAVSKRFPSVSLGTGISLNIPIFTRFGGPAIRTATAKRDRLARIYTAAVHRTRREIAAAHALRQAALDEMELIEAELLPNAEGNLALSRQAFEAGEVTLLETLALQRALVEARTRHLEARIELSKRSWTLLAQSGRLLNTDTSNQTDPTQESR